ncbi:MAG: Glycosyl transferase, family 2 [Parcubacteria group bacterium GW2011_GWA2_39_18]|nr:MAG: Glycosyl transferase, family 2 [Parcubacteria group bacterium GW2011_GWA2_39_18]
MEEKIFLSVIIPAYNESGRGLEDFLNNISSYLKKQSYTYEIVLVNDGSNDNTLFIAQSFVGKVPHLRVIDSQPNRGKGIVIRKGMLESVGQVRLFTDADNSTSLDHFEKMKPLFDQGTDVVIASRNPRDAIGAKQAHEQSLMRRLMGMAGNLLIQTVAVFGIWDTQCGFKAFTEKAAKDIFSRATVDRWGFDIEILAIAKHLKFKIGKIPAYWVDREGSHISLNAYLNVFLDTFRVRWNLIRGRYDKRS